MDISNNDSIVSRAYREPKKLGLKLFLTIETITNKLDFTKASESHPNTTLVSIRAKETFTDVWDRTRLLNKNLDFYNSIKTSFEAEPYTWPNRLQNSHFLAILRTI